MLRNRPMCQMDGQGVFQWLVTDVELDPITLVDCIVAPIGRMADVKVKKETSIQRARRVN